MKSDWLLRPSSWDQLPGGFRVKFGGGGEKVKGDQSTLSLARHALSLPPLIAFSLPSSSSKVLCACVEHLSSFWTGCEERGSAGNGEGEQLLLEQDSIWPTPSLSALSSQLPSAARKAWSEGWQMAYVLCAREKGVSSNHLEVWKSSGELCPVSCKLMELTGFSPLLSSVFSSFGKETSFELESLK